MEQTGRVKFITLGCKVNQYETQGMREILAGRGFVEDRAYRGEHDFVVINTCTVTAEADRENRYWIRRMRRENPDARIVVTGCYVEHNRRQIEALPEVDLVLSNHEKADLTDHLLPGCGVEDYEDQEKARMRKRQFTPLSISSFQGRGRAFVKIQDGCNHSCSFCKVVLVRGRSRSREAAEILDEVERLRDAGYREIVFTGIQLGAYGLEQGRQDALAGVLEASARIPGIERLRLSSIEPTDLTPSLIQALRDIPECVPHLHIPLQSGDDEILRAMNRRHDSAFYRGLIDTLRTSLEDFSLSLDVMAGFPGETEKSFQNTIDLLRYVRPLKAHVFPYSAREGTRAARLENLPVETRRQRVQELIRLTDAIAREERTRYLASRVDVLVEKKLDRGGLVQGLTGNYLKVCFQADTGCVGKVLPVELLSLEGDLFLGRLVQQTPETSHD